jgi:hypothetical protein
MADPVSMTIAGISLAISAVNAWLTLWRRGTVNMTQPTVIFFGPDTPRSPSDPSLPKIYLRTLLFATSKKGRVIESMHVALSRNETHQNFNIWVHGDEKLVRGSGLYVGETGVAANHHFLTPRDANSFQFGEGRYRLDVYAHLLGDPKRKLLFSETLEVSQAIAAQLKEPGTGVYFDWGPDSSRYLTYVEKRPSPPERADVSEFLSMLQIPAAQRAKPTSD